MNLHALHHAGQRSPADESARILLRAHLDARSYRPCRAAAATLVVPAELRGNADLRAAAALAVAETFGLLDAERAAATIALLRCALAGAADEALERAPPEVELAWYIAVIEWCERNGLDREFAGLQARAARADGHPAAPPWARVHWRIAAAWHHEAFGRRDSVIAALDQAQEIADRSEDLGLQVAAWLKRARLAVARRAPQEALELAKRATANADEVVSPLWLGDAADVMSTVALAEGDMHRALQHARSATGFAQLAQATPAYAFTYRVNEGYALLGLGAWDDAVALFRELAAIPLPDRLTGRLTLIAELVSLVRDERSGRWDSQSNASLAHCIRRMRELDYPGVLAHFPGHLGRLWARALRGGIEPDWVLASIRSRRLPAPEPGWPHDWPWPLKVRLLGAFSCTGGRGELLATTTGKAAARPFALLRRIAAEGGYDGVPADTVARDLWPGDGRKGREKALETTLARLRKLLGHAESVLLQERRLRLNPQVIWLDSAALAQEIRILNSPDCLGSPESCETAWREIFEMWRGPPLAGEARSPWFEALRSRLRAQLAAALLRHALTPGHRERCLRITAMDPALSGLLEY
jgi:DNA-binding SARP family transcriptional activator